MNTQNIYTDDLLQGTDDNIQDRFRDILRDERDAQIFENHMKNAKVITGSMKFHVSKIGRLPKIIVPEK